MQISLAILLGSHWYLFRIDCIAVNEDSEYVQMLEMKQTVPLR